MAQQRGRGRGSRQGTLNKPVLNLKFNLQEDKVGKAAKPLRR